MPQTILIIGAGQAGGCAAASLRAEGYAGHIIMVGAEPHRPYERPPLSKAVLASADADESIFLHKPPAHDALQLEYLAGVEVTQLDPAGKLAFTSDGRQIAWDRCLLATGGRARLMPGLPLTTPHVLYLRSLDDARALRARLAPDTSVIVIGGGFLGLEFAGMARQKGMQVRLLEADSRLLGRAVPPIFAAWLQSQFEAAGVQVQCNAQITSIQGAESGVTVMQADGTALNADFLLASIGQIPNTELAAASGIAIDNGIAVNAQCETSAPDIFAAGDCASHFSRFLGRRVRLESWQNAQEQAAAAARAMLGRPAAFDLIPWFWSDQLGMNLQMLGMPAPELDYVVRGEMPAASNRAEAGSAKFSIYGFDGNLLRYVLAVNSGGEIRPLRGLMEAGKPIERAVLTDSTRQLRDIVKQALAA